MKLDSNEKTNQLPKTFYVTYFARTHNGQPIKNGGAIITRKGQWHKPNTDTVGRYFVDKNLRGGRGGIKSQQTSLLSSKIIKSDFGNGHARLR